MTVVLTAVTIVNATPVSAETSAASASATSSVENGGVLSFGNAQFEGSLTGSQVKSPIVGMAPSPTGSGYWLVSSDGTVYDFGAAEAHGSANGLPLSRPVVGMAATPSGNGYWLVASDGGIFNYGDAEFFGSMGGSPLNQPIVGIAAAPDGRGYWLVASDGGIFNYGSAGFHGSMGGSPLNKPVVGIAANANVANANTNDTGYWLVASDGGIFNYGSAGFKGSMGGSPLNKSIVGMAEAQDGEGYWMVASDGGVFGFGHADFHGSASNMTLRTPVIGIAPTPSGDGYWMVQGGRGTLFGAEFDAYLRSRQGTESVAVFDQTSGATFVYNGDATYYCASIVKVQIMATLLHNGANGDQRELMRPMIQHSDNNAATALWNAAGGGAAVSAFDRSIGMNSTTPNSGGSWGLTRTTVADQVELVKHLAYPNGALSDADRAYALSLMHSVTPGQRWGISGGVVGASVAVKNGWLPYRESWRVNSIGWVSGSGHDYVIAVLTDGAPSQGYAIGTIEGVSSRVFASLA